GNASRFFGGGIIVNPPGALILTNSAVVNCKSENNEGGGIYFNFDTSGVILNSTISGNSAEKGGGISVIDSARVTILNSTVAHNTATSTGGGIALLGNAATLLTLESTLVADNTAPVGADLARPVGTVNANRSLIENPQAGAINGTNTDNVIGQDP